MTLEGVKNYMRVDEDADDELIIFLMNAAEDILENSCGRFDESKPRAKMLYLAIVQDLYDNRTLTATPTRTAGTQNLSPMMRSMLSQLQIEEFMEEGD